MTATVENTDRKAWMGILASAPVGRVSTLLAVLGERPDHVVLRPAEVGSVMVRGRAGGTGAPFNLGEVTVSRCSIRLASGEVGHGYVQGRSLVDAEAAALVDALMQTTRAGEVRATVLDPIAADRMAKRKARAEKAAATKVEFFTMVRGED
jgi:alpha-D-ribose 1-methylphosphonate 5-triphosphate synthase subunit PhnG